MGGESRNQGGTLSLVEVAQPICEYWKCNAVTTTWDDDGFLLGDGEG